MIQGVRFQLPDPLGVLEARGGPRGWTRVRCEDGGAATFLPERLPAEARASATFGARLSDALARYLAGEPEPFDVPIDPIGTPFQVKVWAALRGVPHGTVITYGELATRVGSHPRAVGQAVSQNPLWIVVPCHRVVGSDGRLTGYAGGLHRKEALLRIEGGLR